MSSTRRLRIDRLLLLPNIPSGMNPLVLMSLVYMYRSTDHDAEPITVTPTEYPGVYRIKDGRHRFMASVIAGRRRVLAVIEQ